MTGHRRTIGDEMREAARSLSQGGVPDAARDVRWLMADALGIERDRLILAEPDPIPPSAKAIFDRHVAARAGREPVSRILGTRSFYGRDFNVTPYVLDPRPETEVLIARALAGPFDRVLDLGTGSGCIILTLLAERSGASGVATDISREALETAATNARQLGVAERVKFEQSDWFECVVGKYDLIVSNPPYIAPEESPALSPEVRRFDPGIALFDRDDGLSAYRRIAAHVGEFLAPGGRVMVEIGPTQGPAVAGFFRASGLLEVAVFPDLDGRDRVVEGRAPPKTG